jgi:hypothetical protein
MPPVVRSWGEEQKVIEETGWGGLNPLRGPLAALTALPECNAQALMLQEKRRANAELGRSFQRVELAKKLANVAPTGENAAHHTGRFPHLACPFYRLTSF